MAVFIGRKHVSCLFLQTEGNEWDLLVSRICLHVPLSVRQFAQNAPFLRGLLRITMKSLQVFVISVYFCPGDEKNGSLCYYVRLILPVQTNKRLSQVPVHFQLSEAHTRTAAGGF